MLYWAKNKALFMKFLMECEEKGYTWNSGEKATSHPEYWDIYEEDTIVEIVNKKLTYTEIGRYSDEERKNIIKLHECM